MFEKMKIYFVVVFVIGVFLGWFGGKVASGPQPDMVSREQYEKVLNDNKKLASVITHLQDKPAKRKVYHDNRGAEPEIMEWKGTKRSYNY